MKKYLSMLAIILLGNQFAVASNCSVNLTANDQMKFNTNKIIVPKSCDEFTINLEHIGKLPRTAMGHNVVIAKASDKMAIAADGSAVGLDNEYIKPGDDRVIAYSKVIGGGEKTSLIFKTFEIKNDENYIFFCSFPGHVSLMTGSIIVK